MSGVRELQLALKRLRQQIRRDRCLNVMDVSLFIRLRTLLGKDFEGMLVGCGLSRLQKKNIRETIKQSNHLDNLVDSINACADSGAEYADGRVRWRKERSSSRREYYSKRFNTGDVKRLRLGAVSARNANLYPPRLSSREIVYLCRAGVMPRDAARYGWRFGGEGIARLASANIPPPDTARYDKHFSADDILELAKKNVKPRVANRFAPRFDAAEILRLLEMDIHPKVANRFYKEFDADAIVILSAIGIHPSNQSKKYQRRLFPLLRRIVNYEEVSAAPDSFRLIGTGASAAVLLKGGSAWKFSRRINDEYRFLRQVDSVHHGRQKNVVKVKGVPENDLAVQLEYIDGKPLEELLQGERGLLPDKVIHYGAGICNGILELRQAGVYHRDLHDRNVIIDADDSAIIIDLGVATDDPYSSYKGNRAYGGNNDLISLGQLMYKMATGRNLFKEGPGFTCYSMIKENVKTMRALTYLVPDELAKVLESIKIDIKDRTLADITVMLLDDDLWTQPSLEEVRDALKMFERYGR
ncbi:MAG: protein kinase [Nanoarchaeota archaeon]|nr:protein kinase [Nanoarchaeota archaeon]